MNTGQQSIEWLYREKLKVDEEWSIQTPAGFKWWADKNAQTIEVLRKVTGPNDSTGYLISVRTEFLRNLKMTDSGLNLINALLMPFASLAGAVYDNKKQALDLCSLVLVHDGISSWMNPIISLASIIQIGEVSIMSSALAEALDASESLTGHPQNGVRPNPDELTCAIADFIAPLGELPCRWTEKEFENLEKEIEQPPALLATRSGMSLTAEFPYGKTKSSLCEIMGLQPHPRYGNGLFVLQSFPIGEISQSDGILLALMLNEKELTETPFGYGFGSYAYREGNIHFTSFFPNAMYKPGFLLNLYYSCGMRAKKMSLQVTGCDWTEKSFNPRRSAAGRILELTVD